MAITDLALHITELLEPLAEEHGYELVAVEQSGGKVEPLDAGPDETPSPRPPLRDAAPETTPAMPATTPPEPAATPPPVV